MLSQTAPDAKIIGVIDSDVVRPDWLKALVPYLTTPDQLRAGATGSPAPQGDRFKEMLNWEYASFFDIGMCLRNEYDAHHQHGTGPGAPRPDGGLGGWATWSITEDTSSACA